MTTEPDGIDLLGAPEPGRDVGRRAHGDDGRAVDGHGARVVDVARAVDGHDGAARDDQRHLPRRVLRGERGNERRSHSRRHRAIQHAIYHRIPIPSRLACRFALSPSRLIIVRRMSVHIVPHPLIHDALIQLRDVRTETEEFRALANRISVLLVAEALRDLPTERATAQTPLEKAEGRRVARDVVVVPVLRAGLGMLDAVLELLPSARVGHIGLQRDESTAVASQYYAKLPDNLPSSYVVLVDPMLATGGSAVAALDVLKKAGATNIRIVCIVAAPEGIALGGEHRIRTWRSTRR